MLRESLFPLAVATAALALVMGSTARAGQDWRRATEAAVLGGGYAAGEAIGSGAIGGGGYDGGSPVGFGGNGGPSDRPCYTRRPVYNTDGVMIGYRGQQLC